MKKEMFFGRVCGQNISVVTEEDKIIELDFESDDNVNLVGNIYKGRVMNVLAGMQAAFVSCGLDRNCYLSIGESRNDYSKFDGEMTAREESLNLSVGEEILVQVTKPPRGNKGAKVTTKLSYVGKNLIYVPDDPFVGVSRKIEDEELRANLLFTVGKLRINEEGMIVRTAAPQADRKTLKKELEMLRRIDADIRKKYATAKVGDVLYTDEDLFHRTVRDLFNEKVSKVYVGDEKHYAILKEILCMMNNGSERKLVLYNGERDMLVKFNLLSQIINVLKPVAPLENGGYLVIEKTEAMTVIDVNTGKFVGKENLENTVFATNIEAAKEIARQVRLRNIGGIVAVDFIDMAEESHKKLVTKTLADCLAKDKTKCNVLPMSDFCVTEFTRKRLNHDVAGLEMKPCSRCDHSGYILCDSLCAMQVRCAVSDCFLHGYTSAIVELNPDIMTSILSNHWFSEYLVGKWKDKRVYLVPRTTYNEEKYTVRGDNSGVLTLPDTAQMLY